MAFSENLLLAFNEQLDLRTVYTYDRAQVCLFWPDWCLHILEQLTSDFRYTLSLIM